MLTSYITFNGHPHINDCSNDLESRLDNIETDCEYGFCLQHKHFELNEGEVLLYTFDEMDVSCEAVQYDDAMYPCMYYSDGSNYVPVGYTFQKECSLTAPKKHYSNIGVCSMAFAYPGRTLETTNECNKTQTITKSGDIGKDDITTMLFPSSANDCSSNCSPSGVAGHISGHIGSG